MWWNNITNEIEVEIGGGAYEKYLKFKKSFTTPLTDSEYTLVVVVESKDIRPALLQEDNFTHALFLSYKGTRIGKTAIDKTIRKYAKLAKLKKKVSPHTFRHTCATHLVNSGMNIRHVQALLGHSSLSSTQVYTKVAIKDLKRVIKKHHPREKIKTTISNPENSPW